MGEEGLPQGPPPGVPSTPQTGGLVHEDLIAQPTGMVHEDQVSQSIPQAQSAPPVQGAAPQGMNHGESFTRIPSAQDLGELVGISPKGTQAVLDTAKAGGSLVAKITSPLALPLRAETSALLAAGKLLGVPGASELHDKLNPEGRIFPDAYVSDISNFYLDKAAKAMGMDYQTPAVRTQYEAVKTVLGLAANIGLDPIASASVGRYTSAAQELQKAGKITEAGAFDRNILNLHIPFTDIQAEFQGKPIQQALSPLVNNPATQAVAKAVRALSPDTGVAELDQAGRTADALKRGDPVDVINRYGVAKDALKMTSDEDQLASALVEATPNLKPNVPDPLLQASGKTWAEEQALREQIGTQIQDTAKKLGIEIAPGREDAITEAAILAKKAGAENLEDKFNAGTLTKNNIATETMDNHLHRTIDPNYRNVKDAETLEAQMAKDEADVNKTTKGTFADGRDHTQRRDVTRGMNLQEANEYMKKVKGVENYFITDPVKAQIANLVESKRLLRDSQYLSTVKKYGQLMSPYEALSKGMVPINHPELGKTMEKLYYPRDIASKIQSRVYQPPLTGLSGTLQSYNRVFRSLIFMSSPGIRLANSLDNQLKTAAVTGKDFIQSSKDALAVLLGKSEGFRSAPSLTRPNGVFYDGAALKSLLDKYGITRTGAWSEGMEPFLAAGKKLTLQEALQRPSQLLGKYTWQRAQSLIRSVDTFGEKGENTARAALFLQRLRAGWEPEQAAGEVTKWLFDYNRNSPIMENVRMVMPFMQHPFKTLAMAPELVGTNPGMYNFIQNTMPHVIANAFHDPVTQAEINTLLPDHLKQRDAIAGPFIPGNTWMASIFGSQNPKLGSLAWFDPRIGMRILNHFDYFNKGGEQKLFGETSPVIQGLLGMASGEDFGAKQGVPWRTLDYANGNVNVANRASYLLSRMIGGVSPFPNAEKILMQAFGLVDPKHIEPNSVLIMKGLAGQFGGITDLDRDVQSKLLASHYAFMDQKKQFVMAARNEIKDLSAPSVWKYVKSTYGSITGTTPSDLYKQMNAASQESAEATLGSQALGGGMSAGDFAARMIGLSENMRQLNQAYQTLGARKLQMSQTLSLPKPSR